MKNKIVKTEFHKMQDIPERAYDLNGNEENFSVPVLVYDNNDSVFCEIGHYNFDAETWNHFGEASMKLICWCYIPDPTKFRKCNDMSYVLHDGYRD